MSPGSASFPATFTTSRPANDEHAVATSVAPTIQVGFLAMNRAGQYGAFALQKGFSYAVRSGNLETVIPGNYYYK